jgi:methionine-gamma-lyase
VYGGTYALLKNVLPRFGVETRFVPILDLDAVERAMSPRTKVLYCESVSNPLLDIANLPELAKIAHRHGAKLVVDNTFTPMVLSPLRLGADVVVHSMTKFINGSSDCVAGCVVSTHDFIAQLNDVNTGTSMLLGPVLDSLRAASILKNLHTLHVRMRQHSHNALYLAERLEARGMPVHYPGLPTHPGHDLLNEMMNPGFGYSGMLTIDVGSTKIANRLMTRLQEEKVGYLAVSLGYFKTLFSSPSHSTSSEVPEEEQRKMGLSEGLIRFSIGLDQDIERTANTIERCLEELGVLPRGPEAPERRPEPAGRV